MWAANHDHSVLCSSQRPQLDHPRLYPIARPNPILICRMQNFGKRIKSLFIRAPMVLMKKKARFRKAGKLMMTS
jgi:hypothetical protein